MSNIQQDEENDNFVIRTPEEEWRNVPGFEGRYMVSNYGQVLSLPRNVVRPQPQTKKPQTVHYQGGILNPWYDDKGYLVVAMRPQGSSKRDRSAKPVHRIVAETFLGPRPPGMDICHDNGIKEDNEPWNLRYDTRKNNHADKIEHGTHRQGEKVNFCKYNENQVRTAKELLKHHDIKKVAEMTSIDKSSVRAVQKGRVWKHIKV